MRSLHRPHVLAALVLLATAAPLTAQDRVGSRGRPGRSGESGTGDGSRGSAVGAARDRRASPRERAGDQAGGEDRGGLRERRREHEALMTTEDRALLAAWRGRGSEGALAPRTPERAAFAQALRDKRRDLRAAVAAGTMDRHAAAEQLRAWLRTTGPASAPSP